MIIALKKDKYLEWRKAGLYLDILEAKLNELYKKGKLSKTQYNKYRGKLNELWVHVWDYYPDKDPSLEQAFKLNFG